MIAGCSLEIPLKKRLFGATHISLHPIFIYSKKCILISKNTETLSLSRAISN